MLGTEDPHSTLCLRAGVQFADGEGALAALCAIRNSRTSAEMGGFKLLVDAQSESTPEHWVQVRNPLLLLLVRRELRSLD